MSTTTKEYLITKLEANGLFRSQAEQIVDFAIPQMNDAFEQVSPEYSVTWDRPSSEYPAAFLNVLFITLKPYVIKWAEKNVPIAWWIPMFQ